MKSAPSVPTVLAALATTAAAYLLLTLLYVPCNFAESSNSMRAGLGGNVLRESLSTVLPEGPVTPSSHPSTKCMIVKVASADGNSETANAEEEGEEAEKEDEKEDQGSPDRLWDACKSG